MTQLVRYSKPAALGAALALAFAAPPALASTVLYSGTECNGGDNAFFEGQYSNPGTGADLVQCPIPIELDVLHPTVGVVATVRDNNPAAGADFSCFFRAITVVPGGPVTIQTSSDGTTGSNANYVSVTPANLVVAGIFTSMSLQCSVPASGVLSSRIAQYLVTRS
jgi:hypothetical protein